MLPFGAYGPGPSSLPPGTPPPLAADCMLPADAAFDPSAEVHVPSACAVPADSPLLGCMVRGAIDYDAAAVQPARCRYKLRGCRSPSVRGARGPP